MGKIMPLVRPGGLGPRVRVSLAEFIVHERAMLDRKSHNASAETTDNESDEDELGMDEEDGDEALSSEEDDDDSDEDELGMDQEK